jgi:hypothetical protein
MIKNNQSNNPFFEMTALPPRADTTLKTEMQVVGDISPILTVYVRSEETVGYHGLLYIAMVYLAALLAALIPIILWLRGLLTKAEQTRLMKMETEINKYERERLAQQGLMGIDENIKGYEEGKVSRNEKGEGKEEG